MLLVLPEYSTHDAAFWTSLQPTPIATVGLQDIRWKELYYKWGKFIPDHKKKAWRYYDEPPPQAKLKAISKQSKEARQQRKQRAWTVHDEQDDNKKPRPESPVDNGIQAGII